MLKIVDDVGTLNSMSYLIMVQFEALERGGESCVPLSTEDAFL